MLVYIKLRIHSADHLLQPIFRCLLAVVALCGWGAVQADVIFSCDVDNDLYKVVSKEHPQVKRFATPAEAVAEAPAGSGVLILADGYPEKTTPLQARLFDEAARKKLRLFVEYPGFLPGVEIGEPVGTKLERAVVSSDLFGEGLKKLRIMSINGLHYLPINAADTHLVAALVAGFDTAVYGLPARTAPLLCELPGRDVLVATTSLSGFLTGRYAPQEAWRETWHTILSWLAPDSAVPKLTWTPIVRASYGPEEELPEDHEVQAIRRGLDWYRNSKMIVHPSFEEQIANGDPARSLPADAPMGDGSLGSLEAVLSTIHRDGTQMIGTVRRGDCISETAMALAFGSHVLKEPGSKSIANNLLDYYLFTSDARKRERGDPENGNFGLIAWGVSNEAWWNPTYGDDNARLMMSTLAVAALNGEDRWDEAMMQCLLGNLRTAGQLGFRTDRIDVPQLNARGWVSHFNDRPVSYAPHFEAYLWACYLWAYEQTGDALFLKRAKTAISMTMAQYTDGWRWTNGLAQEKARIVLPLAWLVRVDDTAEHREWLARAVDGLLALQDSSGAIREELGLPGRGMFPPPGSNEAYGTTEAPLISENGDPVSDLLYTTNFAFLGLHEAAAATGDPKIIEAGNKLAEFLCRIQVRSERLPMVDGGWFRAFDFDRWEPWGSNADHGWGAWAIESGWTQGWITSVLAMRQMKTSLWELTHESTIERHHKDLRATMLPPQMLPRPIVHEAIEKPVTYQTTPSANYPDSFNDLTNGLLGGAGYLHSDWVGWQGENAVFTVDLGKPVSITQLDANCLRSLDAGIHLPLRVRYSVSDNGKAFRELAVLERPDEESRGMDAAYRFAASQLDVTARFIRVEAEGIGTIPAGFTAAGTKAWLFIDELLVNDN